jgi:acyl-coenzyme A thioesterase PaaI-like protein
MREMPGVSEPAVQDRYAPHGVCFGCGPANEKGLRIKSRWETHDGGEVFVCRWRPDKHHQAFPGVLNGGIIGTLLDCHSNWCAATILLREQGLDEAAVTVTSEFHVKLRRPAPVDDEVLLTARPIEVDGNRVTVEAHLEAGGKVCATCRAVLVKVEEGHPAYHRWG